LVIHYSVGISAASGHTVLANERRHRPVDRANCGVEYILGRDVLRSIFEHERFADALCFKPGFNELHGLQLESWRSPEFRHNLLLEGDREERRRLIAGFSGVVVFDRCILWLYTNTPELRRSRLHGSFGKSLGCGHEHHRLPILYYGEHQRNERSGAIPDGTV
jgi:hypothetical protein